MNNNLIKIFSYICHHFLSLSFLDDLNICIFKMKFFPKFPLFFLPTKKSLNKQQEQSFINLIKDFQACVWKYTDGKLFYWEEGDLLFDRRVDPFFLDDCCIRDLRHRAQESKIRRRSWKARAEEEEGEAKGHPCTLDGVSALNVEGRGPFNGRAVSFSPPSSSSSSSLPVLFCEHLPDRPDQMPEDRPPSLQPPSSVDNSIISNNTQYEISQKRIHFMETSR